MESEPKVREAEHGAEEAGRGRSRPRGPGPANIKTVTRKTMGTSLVAQWLRIHLPMQGTRVRALVRKDLTCQGATKPVQHNY